MIGPACDPSSRTHKAALHLSQSRDRRFRLERVDNVACINSETCESIDTVMNNHVILANGCGCPDFVYYDRGTCGDSRLTRWGTDVPLT
jgi:hypothetical protein